MMPVQAPCTRESIADRLRALRLGFSDGPGGFRPVPVTLQPWRISCGDWIRARRAGHLLGRLLTAVAEDRAWLHPVIRSISGEDSLPAVLARYHPADRPRRARSVNLVRHDLLLDSAKRWRWVESNAIAAGMGPFGERAGQLQRSLSSRFPFETSPLPNPATRRQARHLVTKARAGHRPSARVPPPLILFVIAADENNGHDQALLAEAIEAAGGRVVFRTLDQLTTQTRRHGDRLHLTGEGQVDLVYFRTGYNLDDYGNREQLHWRAGLEALDVALCPTIDLQLAASKWTQQALSRLSAHELTRFDLSITEARQIRSLMVEQHRLAELDPETADTLLARGWLLKSQREGGGSVLAGPRARAAIHDRPEPDALLMQAIDALSEPDPVGVWRDGALAIESGRIPELGVFTLGKRAAYGGHLVRSKSAGALEAGVHAGDGMLDALALSD